MEKPEKLCINYFHFLRSENVIITKPCKLHIHSSILDMISDQEVISARDNSYTEKHTYGEKLLQFYANLNFPTEEFGILADEDLKDILDDQVIHLY
eukprot:5511508-Ditylum_brightwellii.AAC.1